MRPLRLSFQAFGPFAGQLEIDFRTIGNAALFGFYGPTGSGKTSVLDAICFALFGESSGGEREGAHLRSDHATPKVETYVSLVFSVGSRKYFIYRKPEYEKKKLRGEGTTKQKHEATLFDVTGLETEDIGIDSNPGLLLAEKKTSLVKEKIVEILGYNAKQFRQVVMLPQGKFRDFLIANSETRSSILRQLFDMSLFENLEQVLKEKSRVIRDEIQAVAAQRDGILSASGLESVGAVEQLAQQQSQEIEGLAQAIKGQEAAHNTARSAFEKGQKTSDSFAGLEKAVAVQKTLLLQQEEMNLVAERLDRGHRATQMRHIAEALATATGESQKAGKGLEAITGQRVSAQAEHERLGKAFRQSETQQPLRDEQEVGIRQGRNFLKILQAQQPLQHALAELQQQKQGLQKQLSSFEGEIKKCADQLKSAQDSELSLQKNQQFLGQKQSDIKLLEIQLKQASSREEKQRQLDRLKKDMVDARKDWVASEQVSERSEKTYQGLEREFMASQAVILAQGLETGEACPVCGGKDHPSPAHMQLLNVNEEELKAAKTAWELAYKALHETANVLKQVENQLAFAQKDLEEQENQFGIAQNVTKLKQVLAQENKQLKALTQEIAQGEKAGLGLATLEQQHLQLLASLEQGKQQLTSLSENIVRKDAQAQTAMREIPDDFQSLTELKSWLETEVLSHDKAVVFHKKAGVDFQDCASRLTSLLDQEKLLQSAQNDRSTALVTAQSVFVRQLEKQNFADANAYSSALLKATELDTLQESVKQYGEQKKAAEAHVMHCQQAVGKQEKPDMDSLGKALAQCEASLQNARKGLVQLQGKLDGSRQTLKQYSEKSKAFEMLDLRYRRAKTLSDVANGTGDNQPKIRLVDWLLSSYFDDVLAQANIRFSKMTCQRFFLRRSEERAKGGRASGLDIEIYDDWLDSSRPAVSLSGGESFLAALALALGLSDVVQQESGGVVLETIFIDEGFGHLDEEALGHALNALTELSSNNRTVGIISHVDEVKHRVPAGFDIVPSQSGSDIRPRNN